MEEGLQLPCLLGSYARAFVHVVHGSFVHAADVLCLRADVLVE